MNRLGIGFIIIGIMILFVLKMSLVTAGVFNVQYLSLSFYPVLSLFFILIGIAILFYSSVQSEIITLLFIIVVFIFLVYVYVTILGFGGLFGFKIPTGLP